MPKIAATIKNGQQFDRLIVLRSWRTATIWRAVVKCVCRSVKEVNVYHLRNAAVRSCGCFRSEQLTVRNREANPVIISHGLANNYLYSVWYGIVDRCHNPDSRDFERYGGRGITVYDAWRRDVSTFVEWVTENLGARPIGYSLDRIDNNGKYEPGNVRWASSSDQARNRRSNVYIVAFGQKKLLVDWAREYKVHPRTIQRRLNAGWSSDCALVGWR